MLFPIFVTPLLFESISFLDFGVSLDISVFMVAFVVNGVFSSTIEITGTRYICNSINILSKLTI